MNLILRVLLLLGLATPALAAAPSVPRPGMPTVEAVPRDQREDGSSPPRAAIERLLEQARLYGAGRQTGAQRHALHEALRIAEGDPGLADLRLASLTGLAGYHLALRQPRDALVYAERAEALARTLDTPVGLATAVEQVGTAEARLGRYERGVARIEEAIAMAGKLADKRHVIGMTEELVRVHEAAGRYRQAVEAMQTASLLNEERMQLERARAVAELQERYSAERKTREIERLSGENRVKEAEVRARRWQQRLWTAVAVVLAMAALPLLRLLRRVRSTRHRLAVDNAALAEQSAHDRLTGAFNRRHCQTLMARYAAPGAAGSTGPARVGLMLLDLDFFKRINDDWGHAAGDAVLVELVRRLQGLLREQDAVVRWGGEEFLLVLPGASAAGLAVLAERVLERIGSEPFPVGQTGLRVTASIGAIVHTVDPSGPSWDEALERADRALYRAKAEGRNRALCAMGTGGRLPDPGVPAADPGSAEPPESDWRVVRGPLGPSDS